MKAQLVVVGRVEVRVEGAYPPEIGVAVFDPRRPIARERIFEAGSRRPAGAPAVQRSSGGVVTCPNATPAVPYSISRSCAQPTRPRTEASVSAFTLKK